MHHLKKNGKKALFWSSKNFLLANPERFQFLNINPRKLDGDNNDAVLGVDGIDINKLERIKLLGVHIVYGIEYLARPSCHRVKLFFRLT